MHKFLLLPCLFISSSLLADGSIWKDIPQSYSSRQSSSLSTSDNQSERMLSLDMTKLTEILTSPETLGKDYLELPLPNGQQMQFKVEPSKVMAQELATRYPQIRTWKVFNPEKPTISGRIDLTPRGFHGLINTQEGERIFIEPRGESSLNEYVSRNSTQGSNTGDTFNCQVHGDSSSAIKQSPLELEKRLLSRPASSLRTYRIAIATTGEYAQLFGGTQEGALAGVVTTVNRLNQVFERDLSIRLELVGNNDKLIYTSLSADPYSNEDASAMVEENIVNINAVIGADNYDIGHVFGTGNTGGLAFLSSACGTYKAGGVTGSNSPEGEAFDIDYVAHEIGHQLGASHTFNGHQLNCSAGNRAAETAVEPGSGSSIMGYAGICGTDNLQTNSDAFFHSVSINQINAYTRNALGSNCGVQSSQDNNDPTVSAGVDYTIPAETPFKLTGSSSDEDNDPVLHSWEQTDLGSAGGLYTDLGDNPLFRTWPPVSSASRYFPKLIDTLNNTNTLGELLPTTDRQLNFRLLARDYKGGVTQDNVTLNVINTGRPFAVLSQKNPTTVSANQSISVSWDVANTAQQPINCSHVNIGLIDNKGMSRSLATNILNDGAHDLTIPYDVVRLENAHLQVSCVSNIFFAVSEGKIDVLGGDPVISVNSPSINENDSGVRNLTFQVSLSVTAIEDIEANYEVTNDKSSEIIKTGIVVITRGSRTASIQVPITGNTLHEENKVLKLSLKKPLNAQFANESSELTSIGTVIDDDLPLVSANPETTTTPPTDKTSGGGSFSLLSILWLLLLSARSRTLQRKQ